MTGLIPQGEKKTYVFDLYMDDRILLDKLAEHLSNYMYEEKEQWGADVAYHLGCLLEKPSLNYTFQSLQEVYMDTVYDTDNYEYVGGKVGHVRGPKGDIKPLYDVDLEVMYNLTEGDLYRLIAHIWERILTWSIKSPINKGEDRNYLVWHLNGKYCSEDLINAINSILADDEVRQKIVHQVTSHIMKHDVSTLDVKELNPHYNVDMGELLSTVDNKLTQYKVD